MLTQKTMVIIIMSPHGIIHVCDRIWENPLYGIFSKNRVCCMIDKLYHGANLRSSLKPIVRFAEELQRFVCDCTIPPIIEKLQPKGVAMHAYGIPYTTCILEVN